MQEKLKRNYNMSDEKMLKRAKQMLKSLKRDAKEFEKTGIDAKFIAEFEQKIKEAERFVKQDRKTFKNRKN